MTALQKNLIQFNNGSDSIYGTIITFLERKEQNSENTAKTYLRHITDFFRTMRNKELNQLTEEDLIFTKQEIIAYQVTLRKQYKSSTVNGTLSALRSLYSRLEDGFNVKSKWFDVEKYKGYDEESHGVLEHDEILQMVELVKPTRKGKTKQLLIKVAYATAFRLDSLLNLKWTDIKLHENGYWTIKCLGKGKKFDTKKISDDLYEELIEHKNQATDEYIFKLDKKSINRMMNFIRENIDFGDRHIVFHSIKKASINTVGIQTNWNPTMMQKQGNHNDIKTTFKYVKKADLDDMPIVDTNISIDITGLETITHDELIQIIKMADMETKTKLNKILKEMNK
jgi:integrase